MAAGDYKSSVPPGAKAGGSVETTFVEVGYSKDGKSENERPVIKTETVSDANPISKIATPY